jgi:type IV pilus assembly protein PilB
MSDWNGPPHKKLGDILEDCNVVSHAQVEAALAEQQRTGKLFGEALLDLGFVSEDDLGWALSAQFNVPYIDLNGDMVDKTVARSIEPDLLRRYRVLPLVRVGDALTVAVADPTNREGIRAIEQATRLTVQMSVASPRRVTRILAEILGPEKVETFSSSDLLFREITRPTVSADDATAPRPNPLGLLVARALKERVREIHMDPIGNSVRVRFRRGRRLEEESPIETIDYLAMINRLRQTFGEGISPTDPVRFGSTVRFAEASLRVALTLLPVTGGEALILELDETRSAEAELAALFEAPEEGRLVREWLVGATGLVLVTGPPSAAIRTVLDSLVRDTDRAHRRVAVVGTDIVDGLDGILALPDTRRDGPAPGFDPLDARGFDVVFAPEVTRPVQLDRMLMAASCGRLIVTRMLAPDATAALALCTETCGVKSLLGRALLGIIEADVDAAGRPRAALLNMNERLRTALDAGATPRELARAAESGGYRPLQARSERSAPEAGLAAA